MDLKEFQKLADFEIDKIYHLLENCTNDQIDYDYLNEVLEIHIDESKVFIINKHNINKEIWLSSPFSGGHHFRYKEGKWISSKEIELIMLLKEELGLK